MTSQIQFLDEYEEDEDDLAIFQDEEDRQEEEAKERLVQDKLEKILDKKKKRE